MILYKNRLIIGGITKIITSIIKLIYKRAKILNLGATFFVSVVGLVVYLAGGFEDERVKTIFIILFISSIVLALFLTIKKIFFPKKKNKNVQILKSAKNEEKSEEKIEEVGVVEKQATTVYPKYFLVRQNKNLIMAEYSDRYELYKTENGKMYKLRTDYKVN